MLLTALAFLVGIIILQHCSVLPHTGWLLVALLFLAFSYQQKKWRLVSIAIIGFLWAWLQAVNYATHIIPSQWEGKDLHVVGEVISVPEKLDYKSRFLFKVSTVHTLHTNWSLPAKVRLSWYHARRPILPGQIWRLTIRVKRPNGFMNPQGFDYEAWLFQQGINAIGYVRKDPGNQVTDSKPNLQIIRYNLLTKLKQRLSESKFSGLFQALALGIRSQISQTDWQILQATGTGHLIAISGLHIGLIAGLCYMVVMAFWRLVPMLCHFIPSPKAAAMAAMTGALIYAFLAGLAIPTQRALVMVTVVMISLLTNRFSKPSNVLGLALLMVLILDSRSVLSAGFWLSFGAVALLVYGLSCRYRTTRGLAALSKAQYLITLGLLPLTLLLFQQASLAAPIANLIAIPWVSFITVPLVLSGAAALYLYEPLGEWLLWLADVTFKPLYELLQYLADFQFVNWIQASPGFGVLALSLLGVLLLLSPRGIPVKPLGVVFLLSLFLIKPQSIPVGAVRLTVLDVGQGQAVVVETQGHTLVYDAGPKFSDKFDTGKSVVLPYLIQQNRTLIDTLVVSHGDNDHRGGVESLVANLRIGQLYSGEPNRLEGLSAKPCEAGQSWSWDKVNFTLIHPTTTQKPFRDNDLSCVLKIATDSQSILLTGDIHKRSERHLVTTQRHNLAADILVAPHHGSRSSSHHEFIKWVDPKYVIFTAGYKNRFKHPHKYVIQRYSQTSAKLLTSADHGAIQFLLTPYNENIEPVTFRQSAARHWHRRSENSL